VPGAHCHRFEPEAAHHGDRRSTEDAGVIAELAIVILG
jgi:hypothetical protein